MDYKPCNAHCDDYECPKNAGGVCRAPNPCLGYEEAGKLIAELAETKRKLAEAEETILRISTNNK